MKQKMYFVMLAMGLLSFAMQSCDDDDNAPVSMNMWGFTPDYIKYSEE